MDLTHLELKKKLLTLSDAQLRTLIIRWGIQVVATADEDLQKEPNYLSIFVDELEKML